MQFFENNELVSTIYQRAIALSISKDFAEQLYGKIPTNERQESEQENTRRELLEVERKAKKEKVIEEHGKIHFKAQIMAKFYAKVSAKVNNEFDNKQSLYSSVLSIEDAAPAIMEILAVRAASINRISPLVNSLTWLADELITLVNKPQYRKRSDIQVTDPNLALSYVGLDNLKLVMPTFMLKHWLPISTSPYPLMKRKLWNDGLSVALATRALAEQQGIDSFVAFAAGMLSNIGALAVTRCFITTYNEMHKAELKAAYENRDKRLHDVLVDFDMAPELLHEQLVSHSAKVAADVIELMRFDRLPITETAFDLAYSHELKRMTPLAKILIKAKAYVSFRSLVKDDLISGDEAKSFLAAAKLTQEDISLLKKTDIDHLKLNFK